MSFHMRHWTGEMDPDPSISRREALVDELDLADDEHPDVSITHESEWGLSVFRSGFVVLEHLEEGPPRHLGPLTRAEILVLMTEVAQGQLDEVRSRPWKPGYPPRAGTR
jgi:hypothetical protein